MSKSRRLPYYKDKGMSTHDYWSIIRHEWKQDIKQNYCYDDFELRNPKVIVEDWNYSDYSFHVQVSPWNKSGMWWSNNRGWTMDDVKKWSRK